jgi:hypothetical protein
MRRTATKTAKDQKASSRGVPREGKDQIYASSAHSSVEQEDKDGDQLLPCLHKAARWLLTTPLKIG